MIPRNPEVREQPNLARDAHRTAQVITYATSFGVLFVFIAFDPDHRLAKTLFTAATAFFHAIVS